MFAVYEFERDDSAGGPKSNNLHIEDLSVAKVFADIETECQR